MFARTCLINTALSAYGAVARALITDTFSDFWSTFGVAITFLKRNFYRIRKTRFSNLPINYKRLYIRMQAFERNSNPKYDGQFYHTTFCFANVQSYYVTFPFVRLKQFRSFLISVPAIDHFFIYSF